MTLKFDEWPRKTIRHLFYTTSNFVHQFQFHCWIQTGVTVRKCSIRIKIGDFFVSRDLEIWWMTLKNNRAPLLYYIKLCTAFQSHWHIYSNWSYSPETLNSGQNWLSRVTLKIDIWPWKTTGYLFCTTSSFVHLFKSIGEVKLELQPGNPQVG